MLTRVPLSIETLKVWDCEEGGVVPIKATEVPRVAIVSAKARRKARRIVTVESHGHCAVRRAG